MEIPPAGNPRFLKLYLLNNANVIQKDFSSEKIIFEIKLLHKIWKYRQPEIQGF